MPFYSAITIGTKKQAWRLIFARNLLVLFYNDKASLETNYIYIFKYVISSKSTGILLVYMEKMREDCWLLLVCNDCSIMLYCIYAVTGIMDNMVQGTENWNIMVHVCVMLRLLLLKVQT